MGRAFFSIFNVTESEHSGLQIKGSEKKRTRKFFCKDGNAQCEYMMKDPLYQTKP